MIDTTGLIGRHAPSPTGAQHLGNARTFLLAWLMARHRQGKLILRIEDLETPRIKPWATQQAIDDLAWLGLDWDAAPDLPSPIPLIQSKRLPRYQAVLEDLIQSELAYPCTCTRSDIESIASAPHESIPQNIDVASFASDIGMVYPGTCSRQTSKDAIALQERLIPFAWRFRMPTSPIDWIDEFWGPQSINNPQKQLGDFVIARMNAAPAYQLAVVVDDHDMSITQVTRGADLMISTYRQLALYQHLGWSPPTFFHAPLVVGPDNRRLAKRHGDTRLSTLRDAGISPESIVGYLAFQSGLIDTYKPISPRELLRVCSTKINAFSKHIPKPPLKFEATDAIAFFRSIQ